VYLAEEDHRLLFTQHRAVFHAICDREPEQARSAMLLHLEFAEQRGSIYVSQGRE